MSIISEAKIIAMSQLDETSIDLTKNFTEFSQSLDTQPFFFHAIE